MAPFTSFRVTGMGSSACQESKEVLLHAARHALLPELELEIAIVVR
jgi:hypothetical protein